MGSTVANRAILPRKQPSSFSGAELAALAVAIFIAYAVLWNSHAGSWAYPISFYAILLVGRLVHLLRLISRR